jgi:hypothetical protein
LASSDGFGEPSPLFSGEGQQRRIRPNLKRERLRDAERPHRMPSKVIYEPIEARQHVHSIFSIRSEFQGHHEVENAAMSATPEAFEPSSTLLSVERRRAFEMERASERGLLVTRNLDSSEPEHIIHPSHREESVEDRVAHDRPL